MDSKHWLAVCVAMVQKAVMFFRTSFGRIPGAAWRNWPKFFCIVAQVMCCSVPDSEIYFSDPGIRNSDLQIDSGVNGTMPAESASALIFPEHFEAIEKLKSSN
jgi:hypothetical protein